MRKRSTERIVTGAAIVLAVTALRYWEVSLLVAGLAMMGYGLWRLRFPQ